MSNILNSEDFGLKIYNRFPPKYREDDAMNGNALMRYIQALSDGGFKYSIDEINGIINLIDPDKVDSKILPTLFKQYGLEIFNGIPGQYLRYLLPKLGEMWSRKGSLSAIEFITSSLSGIKTTTSVDYDEENNPTVTVRLEMDYSLGDYFPEADQFTRLLTNFVPFYSDIAMVYSYLFYETQVLTCKDNDFYNITDRGEDITSLISKEEDFRRENIRQNISDSGKMSITESEKIKYIYAPLLEKSFSKGKDTLADKVISHFIEDKVISLHEDSYKERIAEKVIVDVGKVASTEKDSNSISIKPLHDTFSITGNDEYIIDKFIPAPYYESGAFALIQDSEENQRKSAVLGKAVMGLAVLGGYTNYSDKIEDFITDSKSEGAIFSSQQPSNSLLNEEYITLNGTFYTNSVYCYDIITIGGETRVMYN